MDPHGTDMRSEDILVIELKMQINLDSDIGSPNIAVTY